MRIAYDTHVSSNMRINHPVFLDMGISSLDIYSIMILKPLFYVALDLESLKDRCMHPMRSRLWEWSNLGFPTLMWNNIIFSTIKC